MLQNPYKYNGPLDPIEDKLVYVPRSVIVDQMIKAIMRGDYCAVRGPREIGKTTFLQLLKSKFSNA
jgi:predicted AAA+ superfamily ATPase